MIQINLTQSAIKKITQIGKCIKITLEPGGCNGFVYKFHAIKAENKKDTDVIFNQKDLLIIIDQNAISVMHENITIDHEDSLISSGFIIKNNKKEIAKCGCGKSVLFEIKDFI